MGQNDTFEDICNIISDRGVDISTFLGYCIAKEKSFLEMPFNIKELYDKAFNNLQSPCKTTKEKGDALEDLARYLTYSNENLFNLKTNVRTSTNEIDLFLTPSDKGKTLFNNYYKFMGNGVLCECKNYSKNLGVTYVGKFAYLLRLSDLKIGIIFTLKGLTGQSKWRDSKGLIRKIALKEGLYILDFTIEDYKRIKENGAIFLDMVESKYFALKNDIEYDSFIIKHEAEEQYKKENGIE